MRPKSRITILAERLDVIVEDRKKLMFKRQKLLEYGSEDFFVLRQIVKKTNEFNRTLETLRELRKEKKLRLAKNKMVVK